LARIDAIPVLSGANLQDGFLQKAFNSSARNGVIEVEAGQPDAACCAAMKVLMRRYDAWHTLENSHQPKSSIGEENERWGVVCFVQPREPGAGG